MSSFRENKVSKDRQGAQSDSMWATGRWSFSNTIRLPWVFFLRQFRAEFPIQNPIRLGVPKIQIEISQAL